MELISRRDVLARGGALLGALGLAAAAPAAAATSSRVYKLVPSRSCKACSACRRHGRNKLFATSAAADAGRAHKHCRCRVRRTRTVNASQREALFGTGSNLKRTSADMRWAWVRTALRERA